MCPCPHISEKKKKKKPQTQDCSIVTPTQAQDSKRHQAEDQPQFYHFLQHCQGTLWNQIFSQLQGNIQAQRDKLPPN